MIFELIGTLSAGAAMALIVWALNRSFKGRLPGWLMPAAAGGAMFVATISSEYSWYERIRATMPEGMVVADAVEEKTFYRPWTYAKPFVTRFVAVDLATIRIHPRQSDQRIVDLVLYGRWTKTATVPILFDCAKNRRADLVDGVEFGAKGAVLNAQWRPLKADDTLLKAACKKL